MQRGTLGVKAGMRFIITIIVLSCIIFFSAGSLSFLNGWIYIGIISFFMIFIFTYLMVNDPELLAKRIKMEEKEERQKIIRRIGAAPTIAGFVLPGFDYRFGWSHAPDAVVVTSAILVITGYTMFFFVIRQNSYASRIVEVQENQKVIDSGLYSVMRHPMYLAIMIIMIFSPMVLGSYYAVIPMFFYPYILIMRIQNEEEVLKSSLRGYDEYMRKVKYRLIPFIW